MTTTQIKIRIPARRVRAVRGILAKAGTDVGGVVNMLFAKIENANTVPFELFGRARDPETEELLADAEFMDTLRKYRTGKLKMRVFRPCAK
jgi:antitoxin component of RelBE/YafQ-DinJ toxin-antitoxin module